MIMLMMICVIFTQETLREINLNEIVQDNTFQFANKVYRLKVANRDDLKHQQLALSLFSHQETLKVYINCDTHPTFLDQYQWQFEYTFQLNISYLERNFRECSDLLFYIAILSESSSNYEFIVYPLDGIHSLEYNLPLMQLYFDQIKWRIFKLQPTYFQEEITIEIQADTTLKYLKKCSREQCFITQLDYKNTQYGIFIEKETYTFRNSVNLFGYYVLGLLSEFKQFFRIIIFNQQSHIKLKEGHYDLFQVDQGSSIYYIYNTSDLTNIKKIKFQLSQITGNCILYASSQNKFPSQRDYEFEGNHQITTNQTSAHFLSVYGISFCKYHINVTVERKQTIQQTQFIQLSNGIFHLHQQQELYSFFKIQLEIQANFSIYLSSNMGDFMMYVKAKSSKAEIPDSNSFEWKDSIQIDINIDKDNQASTYYIGVQRLNSEGEFVIEYTLHQKIQYYDFGEKIIDSVNENQVKYYKLPMSERDQLFTKDIYIDNEINNLIIYISLNQTNTYPKENLNTYVFTDSTLTIPQQELRCRSCQDLKKSKCFIYMSVTSAKGLLFYTITSQYLYHKIQLHEGCPLILNFKQQMLFYYILSEKEVSVQWFSYGGSQAELLAYLGYLNNSIYQQEQFRSQQYNSNSYQTIIIPENNQEYILYIQVQPYDKHIEDDKYSIGVYETVKTITPIDKIQDKVGLGQIKYYMLKIDQNVKSIIIKVQVLGRQNSIVVLFQQDKNSRPNILNNSIQIQLLIDQFYIFQAKQNYFAQDYYIIGIQGEEDCEFQLSYQAETIEFVLFPSGILPLDISEAGLPTIYLYKQLSAFKITLALFTGRLQIRVQLFHTRIHTLDFTGSFILDDIVQEYKLYKFDACSQEQCQYLIKLINLDQLTQGAVQIQQNQQVNQLYELYENIPQFEVMKQNEIVEYIFKSQKQFFIKFSDIFGQFQVTVKENHNNYSEYVEIVQSRTTIEFNKYADKFETFFIKIECLTPKVSFQILISRKTQKIHTLFLGKILNLQLGMQEQYQLRYQSLSTLYDANSSSKLLTLQISTPFFPIEQYNISINHSSVNPIVQSVIKFKRGIYYKLYEAFGKYDLNIAPQPHDSHLRVLLSDDDINSLMEGVPQYQITKVGQPNFYQIFVDSNATLQIEVFTCRGTVLIQGTQHSSNLNKQIFEMQVMSKPQQYFNANLYLEGGIYYFLVKLISSQVKDENQNRISNFYIRHQIFRRIDPIPYTAFGFGNASLNWNFVSNEVIIEIPNLIKDQQFQIQDKFTIYFIVQTYQQDEMFCIYDSYQNGTTNDQQYLKIVQQSSQEQTTQVKMIADSSKIYLSIVGKVEIDYGIQQYELTYPFPTTELILEDRQIQEGGIQIIYYIIALFILLSIIILILRLLCKKKYIQDNSQQNAKDLNIEMNYQTFNKK
ncbi:unnamed protein product (macronuclear) [Paramecium tetraurelia]|uniref:Transmembrane protein n=1 Tax=Paramecium tetraurelia TaxID=5888 RepID=A0D7R4_PARTE|nr:uncharacterized protein GSPATT00014048001 [Paramecium tetraurelia]CAK79081.1 unnamed protein product [Paramecium tetraurelia]|eukprot:XP_001446478.1 hypothetical protein (macronuclear) [Paramecium tetraurelia strain d4-2]